jgi:type II secretory pathway pseudopilin PulG
MPKSMHHRSSARAHQRGMTLMEILIGTVIFVFLLGSVGSLVLANRDAVVSGTDVALLQNARAQIQQCANNYGTNFAWVTTQQAIRCGAVPEQRVRGTQALNAFDGIMGFSPGTGNSSFIMSSTGVPGPSECMSEAAVLYGTWVSVTVNGTNIPQNDKSAAIAAAAAACLNNANALTFESR